MKMMLPQTLVALMVSLMFNVPTLRAENVGEAAPSFDKLRIALVNIRCVYSDLPDPTAKQTAVQTNIDRHMLFVDRALAQGAQFIGFPELSLNGYRISDNMAWLRLDGPEVGAIADKARQCKVYISVGVAEVDQDGKRWNTQIVIGPEGRIIGKHHKHWLTKEAGHAQAGDAYEVFEVKGLKVGIAICADGSDYRNLKRLVDRGAQLIYGPHANTTGRTIEGWYQFRACWGGKWNGQMGTFVVDKNESIQAPANGWIHQLKVYAALHNHAGLYHPDFNPPVGENRPMGWASGAWVIGPDGQTLAQMPRSSNRAETYENLLICDIPLTTP